MIAKQTHFEDWSLQEFSRIQRFSWLKCSTFRLQWTAVLAELRTVCGTFLVSCWFLIASILPAYLTVPEGRLPLLPHHRPEAFPKLPIIAFRLAPFSLPCRCSLPKNRPVRLQRHRKAIPNTRSIESRFSWCKMPTMLRTPGSP